ncbi:DnaA N-terminal domain-containing protein [Poseidonocella sp. HB161398]|uniref:DnaA N-terminal domain-containing protein n=1 Tax=Poseidonocella sp. HB161398 TaxID=2320855 RepID=UPI001486A9D5|nr:DnaA N-terminal domain-containing protein [Poseidonocella sp. HB161398]
MTPYPGGARKLAGPGASSIKYDLLTALLVAATCGDAETSRLALRLSLLITARYNWRQERFTVGQKEIARMWGVTERTAKRDMAAMRGRGWIEVSMPAARGRVAQYRILFDAVLRATSGYWNAVGPDFAARMSETPEAPGETPANVVPLQKPAGALPAMDGTLWSRALAELAAKDPAMAGAWFARLAEVDAEGGTLTLMAPSRFVAAYVETHFQTRILAAVSSQDTSIRSIELLWPDMPG